MYDAKKPLSEPRGEGPKHRVAIAQAIQVQKVTGGSCRVFPYYNAHLDAVCCFCDGPLYANCNSGYSPMYGAFKAKCAQCLMFTWYDCAEGTVELVEAAERNKP